MKLRLTVLLATALLVACGGAGPEADADKSPAEVQKSAADMSVDELEKIVKEYADAINAAAKENNDAKLKDLQEKAGYYGQALAKKRLGGK